MDNPIAGLTNLITTLNNLVKAVNGVNTTIARVFPQSISTSATATGGAATLPANPEGFIDVADPVTGTTIRIPYYNT